MCEKEEVKNIVIPSMLDSGPRRYAGLRFVSNIETEGSVSWIWVLIQNLAVDDHNLYQTFYQWHHILYLGNPVGI